MLSIALVAAACPVHAGPSEKRPHVNAEADTGPVDMDVRVKDGLVFMDVRDADIRLVLEEIRRQAGFELFLDGDFHGALTVGMTGVPLDQALRKICDNQALVFEYMPDDKAFKVTALSAYAGKKGLAPQKEAAGKEQGRIAGNEHTYDAGGGEVLGGQARAGPGDGRDSKGRLLYRPGEILVKLKNRVTWEDTARLHKELGTVVLERLERPRVERLALPPALSEDRAIRVYVASGLVEYAERHALRYVQGVGQTPDDPYFPEQWGLTGIRAPSAWNITTGDSEVIIAVIDSGVELNHPDLSRNIWVNEAELHGVPGEDDDGNGYVDDTHGWDFAGTSDVMDDQNNEPRDVTGHGTHLAGIIGAEGDNGIGIAGVCWDIRIMVLKAQADDSAYMNNTAVVNALYYAIDNGAHLVNCSFGGEYYSHVEYEAFQELRDAGILAVCAAGNSGRDLDSGSVKNYPSSYDLENIISVAAGTKDDTLAGYSNYGERSVDLMAPGGDQRNPVKSTAPGLADTDARLEADVGQDTAAYPASGLEYAGITGPDGITAHTYYCGLGGDPADFPEEVTGNIALIQRGGGILFSTKAANARDAGAIGVVIFNNVEEESMIWTLGSPGDWIPVVGISKEHGLELLDLSPLSLTIINKPAGEASYGVKEGTSIAAAHVSGVAGLLLSKDPSMTYREVKAALMDGADRLSWLSDKTVSGGRVNALCSLCNLEAVLEDAGLERASAVLRLLTGFDSGTWPECAFTCPLGADKEAPPGLGDAVHLLQFLESFGR